jgi:hypothetical protein
LKEEKMKKTICNFYCKQFLLPAILLAGINFYAFAQNGVIKEITGTVELKPAGTDVFVPAADGAQVKADTIISTGFKSTAIVEVGSAVIAVRPLTRLTLTEISASQGTETINVNLQAGRVRVDVKPPAGTKASFSVSSPSATASVRGTRFDFDTRNLRVLEGTVAFKGRKGFTVLVGENSLSEIGTDDTAKAAQNDNNAALAPPSPPGYDPATTGNTGRTGVADNLSEPDNGNIDITIGF